MTPDHLAFLERCTFDLMVLKLFLHARDLCLEETEWENYLEMEMVAVPHWGMGAIGEHDYQMLLL